MTTTAEPAGAGGGAPLAGRIQKFVGALRENGVRVSQQETLDAYRAIAAMGDTAFAEREVARALLSTTLVKSAGDRWLFDRVFDLHFRFGSPALEGTSTTKSLEVALCERGLDDAVAAELAARLAGAGFASGQSGELIEALAEGNTGALAALLRDALFAVDLGGLNNPLQVAYFTQRVLAELRTADVEAQMEAALAASAVDAASRQQARGLMRERLLELSRLARRLVREEYEKRHIRDDDAGRVLEDRPFRVLSRDELDATRSLIRRMCARLKARYARRRKSEQSGTLDVRRTLRKSLGYDGVPAWVVYRRRRRTRPELVVICDVSDSVRSASIFMLQFVYALQDLFDHVRAFAFVDRLVDISDVFKDEDADTAIERVLSGDAVNVFSTSDYGHMLRDFAGSHLESLTRRTTVVILGDGRTNYREPEAELLEEVRRRAQHVVWLCPEGQGTWGTGDSRMPLYARASTRAEVVRTLRELSAAIDRLTL